MSVAIVGLACRFPGASNPEEFWRNLESGVESIRALGDEELLAAGVDAGTLGLPGYVKAAPVLDDYDRFDAGFFGMTPREAELTDPQIRLFIELVHRALEDAGCDPARYPGSIGVYGGMGITDYGWLHLRLNPEVQARSGRLAITTSSGIDYVSTLASYRLDLRGPSLTVQTACSTSLVAVHLACESLLGRECDMALAGAASIELPQIAGYHHLEGGIESPNGQCRAFDADARGTVWGSGGGVVALKRLEDALADGDRVQAVILGTAANNDGSRKVGFSAPGQEGQARVVAEALSVAGVDPGTITYVEAHGTGTPLGDPVEIAALTAAYRRFTDERGYCAVGSVKTNIGHLGPAAGVAGLIKTVLALRHRRIPPSLHFERPNPGIDFDGSPFFVNAALSAWQPPPGQPRRAGVSSFGIGGTNAHAVVEEAPEPEPAGPSRPHQLLVLSTKRAGQLDRAAGDLAVHLREHPAQPLADVAHTLQVGRAQHPHRRALVADSGEAAAVALDAGGAGVISGAEPARPRKVAFMFPGQGAQHPNMGRQLWEREQVYRDALDRCADLLHPDLGLDLRDVLFPRAGEEEAAAAGLGRTALTQPALFAVEYAVARLWMAWGVTPEALIGHSVGEYVAACLAGVFDLEGALRLVAARGRLMQALPPGAMLVVPAGADHVRPLLPAGVDVAALNAPALTTVSGRPESVAELERELRGRGLRARRLRTSHAFHSAMMDPVLDAFEALVRAAAPRAPDLPVASNLTGTWLRAEEARDPGYWARHLRHTVRFADGVRELLADPDRVLLEAGPGRTLGGLARLQPGGAVHAIPCLRHPGEGAGDLETLLSAAGRLWVLGVDIDWSGHRGGERRRRVALPGHPLDRRRHWVEPPAASRLARPGLAPAGRRLPLERWFSLACWSERPASPSPLEGDGGGVPGPVLVFGDACGLGGELAGQLRGLGAHVVEAVAGGGFAADGPLRYRLDPGRPADYESLVGALAESGATPATIVHCWSLAERPPALAIAPADLERSERLGFFSLLFLAQALAARQVRTPVRLVALTSDALSVTAGDGRHPGGALVAGPCRVLPAELPNLRCRHVDVTLAPPGDRRRARLLEQLCPELAADDDDDVVLRDGRRWARTYEALTLGPAPDGAGLRERGVYLVTGGLGAIGLTVAGDLARRCRARLVLTARSAPPPDQEWDRWLAEHGPHDPTSRRLLAIREMEEAGAEVLVLRADVADLGQVAGVRARLLERFGALHGIVHAAGIAGGGMAEVRTAEQAAAVLAPKVRGTANLHAVFGGMDLDFVSLCSSITAVAGGFGQVDYCAANAFMDAAAAAGAFGRAEVCSVNWGGWLEAGMAVETGWDPFDHPLLGRVRRSGTALVFEGTVSPETTWALAEHRIAGRPVLPGTVYLELARAAFVHAEGAGPVELGDVEFVRPLAVPDGERRELRLQLRVREGEAEFQVLSAVAGGGGWQEHARGAARRPAAAAPAWHDPDEIAARCRRSRAGAPPEGLVSVGPRWSSLRLVRTREDEALGELEAPEVVAGELASLPLHPALLDAATALAAGEEEGGHLPVGYGSVTVTAPLVGRLLSHARLTARAPGVLTYDLALMDLAGLELVAIRDFVLRRVDEESVGVSLAAAAPATGEAREGVRPAEGADAFRRLVAWHPGVQVVVSPTDLAEVRREARRPAQETPEGEHQQVGGDGERAVATAYVAPRSEAERVMAQIWSQTLGVGRIGIEDDFFELGGHSLVAIQLLSVVHDRTGVRLPVRALFRSPTVAGLAQAVEEARRAGPQPDVPRLVPLPRGP